MSRHRLVQTFLCLAILAASVHGEPTDCDLRVVGEPAEMDGQPREKTEEELVRQLAIKLRQFDRCLERDATGTSNAAAGSASSADAAESAQVADGNKGGQNPNDGKVSVSPSAVVSAQVGESPGGAEGIDANDANTGPTNIETAARQGARQDSASPSAEILSTDTAAQSDAKSSQGASAPESMVEDDAARMLREAAEKESDPSRKAALWKEYYNYVKNL